MILIQTSQWRPRFPKVFQIPQLCGRIRVLSAEEKHIQVVIQVRYKISFSLVTFTFGMFASQEITSIRISLCGQLVSNDLKRPRTAETFRTKHNFMELRNFHEDNLIGPFYIADYYRSYLSELHQLETNLGPKTLTDWGTWIFRRAPISMDFKGLKYITRFGHWKTLLMLV